MERDARRRNGLQKTYTNNILTFENLTVQRRKSNRKLVFTFTNIIGTTFLMSAGEGRNTLRKKNRTNVSGITVNRSIGVFRAQFTFVIAPATDVRAMCTLWYRSRSFSGQSCRSPIIRYLFFFFVFCFLTFAYNGTEVHRRFCIMYYELLLLCSIQFCNLSGWSILRLHTQLSNK